MGLIVDEAERRNGARLDAEPALQPLARGEAQPVLVELGREALEVDAAGDGRDDEVVPVPFVIAEEEVLAVRALEAGPVLFRFFDRRDRRMLMADIGNAELVQGFEDLAFDLGHRHDRPPRFSVYSGDTIDQRAIEAQGGVFSRARFRYNGRMSILFTPLQI